jgi:hypothetical protein
MALEDGSRVAVIGAGPAGSMFSYFFLSMAETIGLDVKVDIFEPRSFCHRGPAGCNHCGGDSRLRGSGFPTASFREALNLIPCTWTSATSRSRHR